MSHVLFLFVVAGLAYAVLAKPGIALAYVLFGQRLNSVLFDSINLPQYRYILTGGVLIGVFLLHFRKGAFQANISNLLRSRVGQGYIILSLYVIGYGTLIGSAYEMAYLDEFIVPCLVLFLVGSTLVFNRKMYDGLLIGMAAWLTVSFVYVFFIGSADAIVSGDRLTLEGQTGMGAIAQGRMGGVLALIGLLLLWHRRNPVLVVPSLCIMLLGVAWMGWIGTRGALFAFSCSLILYLYCTPTNFWVKITLGVFAAAILYVGISDTLVLERARTLWDDETLERMDRIDRIYIFLDLIPNYFVFGMGPGGWGKHVTPGDYPHNMFIELFIELGLTGLLVFLLIMIGGLKTMKRMVVTPGVGISPKIISVVWVYYAAAVMFSGQLIDNVDMFSISGVIAGMSARLGQRTRVPKPLLRPNPREA